MRDPGRIVLVAPTWLGDAVMSLPAVSTLAAGNIPVTVLSRPYAARVYAGIGGVGEVVVPSGNGRLGRIRHTAAALRALGARAVLVAPPSFSSAVGPWLARVPIRVGYEGDGRGGLLTDALPLPGRGSEHLSESYRRLAARVAERAGRSVPPTSPAPPTLRRFESDDREAAALRARLGVEGDYVVVVPGATYGPAKHWFHSRFRDLVEVVSRDVPVLLAGGPAERQLCDAIADGVDGAYAVAGETSLGGFFSLVGDARALLANDSGTPHAAAALGVPVVVIFGSTSPEWTRPLGAHVTVLRHPVHCAPCFRRTCPTQLECFDGVAVDDAVAALRAAMAAKKGVA